MPVVTVNHDSVTYSVDNGNGIRAMKYDNPGGGSQKTYKMVSVKEIFENMGYEVVFQEHDTDDANAYEGKPISNLGVQGNIDPSWYVAGKLDIKLLKIDAINKLFNLLVEIEPLNASGTVKVEYQ